MSSLNMPEFPEKLPFAGQVKLDLEQAFQPQEIRLGEKMVSIRAEAVGKIAVSSGLLVASDAGDFTDAVPFAAKALPGTYDTVLSVEDRLGTVGMAKLVIRPGEEAIAFVPAKLLGQTHDGPAHLPVDCGCLGFADARTALAQNPQALDALRERFFEITYATEPPQLAAFGSIGENGTIDAVCISSGHGDGGYPCYWGLNPKGEPVCLVVDFYVYGNNRRVDFFTAFSPALFEGDLINPLLAQHGHAVRLRRVGGDIEVIERNKGSLRAILTDAEDKIIADSDRAGSMSNAAGSVIYLQNVPEDFTQGWLWLYWTVWDHAFAHKAG